MSRKPGIYLQVFDSPSGMQLSIDEVEADGSGTGYRIKGPKFTGTPRPVLTHRLSERDVREIRCHLNKVKKYEQKQLDNA